jgi:hypothetical protein
VIRRLYNALGCWVATRPFNPWFDEQRGWVAIVAFTKMFGG